MSSKHSTPPAPSTAHRRIPAELKQDPSWVLWRYVLRDGKRTKEPYQTNRRLAKTNSRRTMTTFDKVHEAYERDDFFDGIGFVFHKDNPYAGADIDHVTEDEAREWIDRFDSYAERSPSGNGFHIIVKTELPQGTKRDAGELYSSGRFFTVTGDIVRDAPIRSAQYVAEEYYRFLRKDDREPPEVEQEPAPEPVDLPDNVLLQKAANSKYGDEFRALWAGDISVAGGDHSRADYRLMKHLMYRTGGDEARSIAMFSQSGLARRPKWKNRADYRQRTARKARMATTKFYQPGEGASKKLEAAVQDLWRRWWAFDWARLVGDAERPNSMRGHSSRDVLKVLIHEVASHGKVVDGGVEVSVGRRKLSLKAATGLKTVHKAIKHLEAEGWLEFRPPESEEKPGTYFMRASLHHILKAQEGGSKEEEEERNQNVSKGGGVGLRAPRLRWSSPGRKPSAKDRRRARLGNHRMPEPREGIKRLGKIRGAVIDALDNAGGTLSLEELAHALGKTRPRDLRRRTLPMLVEGGIIAVSDETVTLVEDWPMWLEDVRVRDGEVVRERLDRERHAREGKAFRNRHEVKLTPHWTNNPEADGAIDDLRRADEPEPEKPQPYKEPPSTPPETDVVTQTDEVDKLVRHGMKRRYALEEVLGCVDLDRRRGRRQQEAVRDDWRKHPIACECDACSFPEPQYARPHRGRSSA